MRRPLAVVLLAAVLVGCSSNAPAEPLPAASEPYAPATVSPSSERSLPTPQPRPVRIKAPAIDIDGEVMIDGLGLDASGGHAEPPMNQPQLASWYNLGPRPGERGPSVILGHVNGGGQQGVFATLHRAQVGTRVFVEREDGSQAEFEIYRIEKEVLKTNFPADEVYGPTAGSEIRLITCGGELDRAVGHYRSNVIAWAKLV